MTSIASELENIKKTEEGYLLTPKQIQQLAQYIEDLRTENEKLKVKLEKANALIDEYMKQIKNYEELVKENKTEGFIAKIGTGLTGAGLASLLILISQGLGGK
jgi:uncharacterized coiled-coil DUF342 family protein